MGGVQERCDDALFPNIIWDRGLHMWFLDTDRFPLVAIGYLFQIVRF